MKVLIISDLAPPVMGGIESYVINLSKGLIKKGHEVHWLTSKLPNTSSYGKFEGIHMHRVSIPFSKQYMFPGRQFFPFFALVKGVKLARKMDVVHVNTLASGFLGWLVAKLAKKPSLLFCHEFYGKLWRKVGRNPFEKYVYPLFETAISLSPYDHYAFPSKYSKKTFGRSLTPYKSTIIPHGIDIKKSNSNYFRKKYKLGDNPVFGYLGRLSIKGTGQAKNLLTLLEAVKHVTKELPDAKLIFGGAGHEDLLPHIEKLGVKNNVIFLGKVPYDKTSEFFSSCDVVVCPSLSDGFCFLLAEASAHSVPVIGTNLGSHPERIKHNKNGLLVNADSKSIASGIVKVLTNKQLADRLGNNGVSLSKNLDWEQSVRKHLEIYQKLVANHM